MDSLGLEVNRSSPDWMIGEGLLEDLCPLLGGL